MRYTSVLFSGLPGSGKSTTADIFAEQLGWPALHIGGLWRAQWKKAHPKGDVPFELYVGQRSIDEHAAMDERSRELMCEGQLVGDMWHEKIVAGLPTLRVYITAPLRIRAARGLQTDRFPGKTVEQVENLLQLREENQVAIAKKIYGHDYDYRDINLYHVVFNSALCDPSAIVAALTSLLTH